MADVTSPAVDSFMNGLRELFANQSIESITDRKTKWFEEAMTTVKVTKEQELTVNRFNSSTINKMTLSKMLESASEIMTRQADIISRMQKTMEAQKTDALENKAAIIKLQADLIESKDNQLTSLQTTVQKTVQASVQKEVQSYSAVVAKQNTAPALSADSLKQAVKTEEERTNNIIF